jgi:hypothetical protein
MQTILPIPSQVEGYPTADNMWESESNLEHAAELLKEYKSQHLL